MAVDKPARLDLLEKLKTHKGCRTKEEAIYIYIHTYTYICICI